MFANPLILTILSFEHTVSDAAMRSSLFS